jgi:hypothetical protein
LIYQLEHRSSKMLPISMVANGSPEKFADTERSVSQHLIDSSDEICCSQRIIDCKRNPLILKGQSRNS